MQQDPIEGLANAREYYVKRFEDAIKAEGTKAIPGHRCKSESHAVNDSAKTTNYAVHLDDAKARHYRRIERNANSIDNRE